MEMPIAGSGPNSFLVAPNFANRSACSLPAMPVRPGSHIITFWFSVESLFSKCLHSYTIFDLNTYAFSASMTDLLSEYIRMLRFLVPC